MKIALITKASISSFNFPNLWASTKTYYEEYGLFSDHWQWIDPVDVDQNVDQVINDLVEENPKVIGFSLYTWNEGTFTRMARKLREQLPDSYIVFGGPQQDVKFNKDYFRDHPYLDLVIPGDAYGEIIIKEILDNITSNNGRLILKDIPYCYYSDENRNRIKIDKPIDKRNFQWPKNPYRAQEDRLKKFIGLDKWAMIETSRGCPYRCSFCDWGGGTYTKSIKKPFATVLDEIRWLAENKMYGIFFCDANFGLYDIDIEYAKHVVKCKEKYGYPKMVTIQSTKTKMKNLEAIFDILCEAKLLPHLKIAVEDLNEQVLKNIDRVDFPFEEKMEMARRIQKKHNMSIFLEGILGLPGSSLDTIRKDIDRVAVQGMEYPLNHPWVLLPETPAYDPAYREKWGIETVKHKQGLGVTSTIPIQLKEGYVQQENVDTLANDDENSTAEYVVGTYSYSKDDYIEMTAIQSFVMSLHNTGILSPIAHYLKREHDYSYGDFYFETKSVLEQHPTLGVEYQKISNVIKDWAYGSDKVLMVDWRDDFKYYMSPHNFVIFLSLLNPDDVYQYIGQHFAERFDDDRIRELAEYNKFTVFTINYTPNSRHHFNHNWREWLQGDKLDTQDITYIVKDTKIRVGQQMEEIDWEEKRGTPDYLTHFFYRVCYTHQGKKDVKNIESI